MTYEQIFTDLRAKKYAPVYLLMGEEGYYIDLLSNYMQNKILDDTEREFNLTILYGKDTDMSSVINAAKRFPMMSEYQIVILKEAQQIKKWDELQFYLKNPLRSTILVFCYKYGKFDARQKVYKEIQKQGVVFESAKLRDYQIQPWIKKYLQERKKPADEKAIALLSEFLGNDLSKISNELDKLLIGMTASETRITPELVERNIGISKDFNVFELQKALVQNDVLKSNRIIKYFAENPKSHPIEMFLPQLFKFFSNIMLYHYLQDKSDASVAKALGVHPYFAKDFAAASKRFNAWKTMNIISEIRQTDARSKGIKNPNTSSGELMRELIFKILH